MVKDKKKVKEGKEETKSSFLNQFQLQKCKVLDDVRKIFNRFGELDSL